jgi:hypothetical protein
MPLIYIIALTLLMLVLTLLDLAFPAKPETMEEYKARILHEKTMKMLCGKEEKK